MSSTITLGPEALTSIAQLLVGAMVATILLLVLDHYERQARKKKGRGPWSK
jgi:hypothetical protein